MDGGPGRRQPSRGFSRQGRTVPEPGAARRRTSFHDPELTSGSVAGERRFIPLATPRSDGAEQHRAG